MKTVDACPEDARWARWFWVLFFGVLILRAGFIALVPIDLAGDEAYYWDWGRRLSWGYFSKPPFIAWLMAWAGWLGGDTVFGVRIWAALLGTGSMIPMYLLAKRMYGASTGFLAAALFAAMPGAALFSLLMTVDAALMFFWCVSLFAFDRCQHAPSRRGRMLSALLLLFSLGFGHLTKQIMWTFPLLAFLYLLADGKDGRARLRAPWIWIALVGSYASLIPMVLWNANHGWITFKHTEHHFQGSLLADLPKRFAEFVAMQLGVISPVTVALLVGLVLPGLWRWRHLASRERFLVTFSGIPLSVMLLMLLRQGLNGNWGAAFYPAGLVLVAGWAKATGGASGLWLPERTRRWVVPGLWISVSLSALVYVLPVVIHVGGLTGGKLDPLARLRGWKEYADRVDLKRAELPKGMPILIVGHRYHASALAFYLPDHPQVYHWAAPGKIDSQYQIWGGLEQLKGREFLVVFNFRKVDQSNLAGSVSRCFSGIASVGFVDVDLGNGRRLSYQLYRGRYDGLEQAGSMEGEQ